MMAAARRQAKSEVLPVEQLSARVRNLSPSRTIAMNQRARKLREAGVDVIDLSVGEPDFPTPEAVREAAKRAIDEGNNFYTPVAGYNDLREAVSRKLKRENGLDYPASRAMVSNGAKHCIANALLALVDPGDEVLIPAPHWVSYGELVKLAGGIPISLPTLASEGYKLQAADLEAAMGPRTKALILCTPSNPTGAVYSGSEIAGLAAVLERRPRAWVVSDEVYEHIDYVGAHASPASIPSLAERTVLINGVSKAYAMTGWRIGYLAGPDALVKACIDLQGQMTTNASSIAQRAAFAALESGTTLIGGMLEAFRRRRELVVAGVRKLPGLDLVVPEGAFYVFPDVSSYFGRKPEGSRMADGKAVQGSDDFAEFLLDEARVAVVPGSAFGDDRCVRISFASADERLVAALERLGEALQKLG
ncbi:MAG: pyridoxal phosphate-dependent aminotransferase [Rectinemataceae bacterium]|jgi:aspartate aminotransferase